MRKITVSMEEILYYLFLALVLFIKGIGLDEGELLFRACLVMGMLLLTGKFLLGCYNIREMLVIVLLGIFSIHAFFVTGSLGLLIYVLMITGSKNIPTRRSFKVGTLVWTCCMLLSFSLAIFGDRKGVMLVHEKFGLGPILRESLGYTHPNVLHITYVVFMAFVLYNCSKQKKKMLMTILGLLAGDVFVFLYSVSVTGMLASLLLIAFFLYFELRKRRTKIENIGIMLLIPFCVVISTIAPLLGGESTAFKIINKIFNNRLLAIRVYFESQGLSLFGAPFMDSTFAVDNSYVYSLLQYGIVFFTIMMLVYFVLIQHLIRDNRNRELAITCTLLIAGISEPFLFNASIKNITVLFIGNLMYAVLEKRSALSILNREFPFLSRKNRMFTWIVPDCKKEGEKRKEANKKFMVGITGIFLLTILLFVILIPFRGSQIATVYSAPELSDVNGKEEIISALKVDGSEFLVGNLQEGDMAYCFTRENSMLLQMMDWRKLISIMMYVCGILAIAWWCWCYRKEHSIRSTFNEKN